MNFKDNVKRLRKAQGLTQKQLADLLGVSKVSVYYWENGKNDISGESLVALSKALNATVDEILGIEPLPHASEAVVEVAGIMNKLNKEERQVCLAFLKSFLEQKRYIQER